MGAAVGRTVVEAGAVAVSVLAGATAEREEGVPLPGELHNLHGLPHAPRPPHELHVPVAQHVIPGHHQQRRREATPSSAGAPGPNGFSNGCVDTESRQHTRMC